MHEKEEARSSLENSLRAPTKGEVILANHVWLCAAAIVAFVFVSPYIIGTIFELVLNV